MSRGLPTFFDRHGEDAAEIAWLAALAWIDRSAGRAREGQYGRFRAAPAVELRRLRRELAAAMLLARFAVACQEQRNDVDRDLLSDLRQEAEFAGRARRRDGTREAERVRLLRAQARREGRELTDAERWPWLGADAEQDPEVAPRGDDDVRRER